MKVLIFTVVAVLAIGIYSVNNLALAGPADLKVHIWPQPRSITSGSSTVYFNDKAFKFTVLTQSEDITRALER